MLQLVSAQPDAKRNRHPVDELADVRLAIKRLQEREVELRKQIIDGECGLIGFDHEATIRQNGTERVDVKAMREKLGEQAIKPFLKSSTVTVVKVTERQAPDEA